MADKLHVALVSPERELFSGEVDQADLPGTEGNMGILPDHAPLMAALSTGTIKLINDGQETVYFVQGGFADVTPAGLTILAERALLLADMTRDDLMAEIDKAKAEFDSHEGESAVAARQNIDGLEALFDLV